MKRDQMLVEGFLSAYNRYHGTSYKVIRRPEVSNRRTQGVEAVAADEYGRTVALEHTLVEPFKGERSVNSWMLNVLYQFRFLAVTHRSRLRTFRGRGTRTVTISARSTTPEAFTTL